MLVIVPVALLTIAALISLMVALVGDVLIARSRSVSVYELQDALDRIEADARISATFLQTYNYAPSPQGRDGGTGAFSAASPNYDLIFNQNATTQNPYSGTRDLVFYADQPNPCSEDYQSNRPLTVRVIYFTTTEADSSKTLWRRVIVPVWTTTTGQAGSVCSAPWQRDTCPLGSTLSTTGPCQTVDEKVLANVSSITPTYYDETGTSTTDVPSAVSVSVSVSLSTSVAGETLAASGTTRATRINTTTEKAPTDTPIITLYNPTINTDNHPLVTSFTWDRIAFANYYSLRYRINSGAWVYPADQPGNVFKITTARPLDVINIEVTAKNDMGESPVGSYTYAKPLWTVPNLQNNWVSWGDGISGGHTQAAYTITPSGMVVIKGMMKKTTSSFYADEVIFNLPVGLRPTHRLIFPVSRGTNLGRIDIGSDGNVLAAAVDISWFTTIDNISFFASGTTSWTAATLGAGWSTYVPSAGYSPLRYSTDSLGRVAVQGLLSGSGGTIATGLPTLGSATSHVLTMGDAGAGPITAGINQATTTIQQRSSPGAWHTIQYIYHPNQPTGFTNISTFQNGWQNYGGAWPTGQYRKYSDGVVSLKGLLTKVPSTSDGEVLFTLPSGYRPRETLFMQVYAGCNAPALVYINPSGNVSAFNGMNGKAGCVSLDGVNFMADGS